jgi:5,10-methylenetetrahydromethanopterin reductase
LDDLAEDRIICGIGAWWDPLASKVGINRRKPLLAMRETVEVLRQLLNMETVTFDGEFHHVDGINLDVVHGRKEPRNVPIYIGATGMKMMELTGQIADGACLNYLVHPDYNARAMDALERGAKKAGKTIDDIDRPQLMICSVDNDRKKALDGARKMITQYLGQQPHLMKASGVSQELLDDIHQVLTWPATEEEIESAMHLVPDDVVQMCTASGSPEEVKAKVREYISSGATCPILYPLGDPKLMIDIFSEGYSV